MMGKTLSWEKIEETLFSNAKAALLRFTEEHPDEVCSFFAFAWMIVDGDFSICLDTLSNARSRAREYEREATEYRKKILGGKNAWKMAHSLVKSGKVV